MNKKIVSIILVICQIIISKIVLAEESVTCCCSVDGKKVSISGQVENVASAGDVTILVGDENNIIYVNQITPSNNGEFSFAFSLPENLPYGIYPYKIGSNLDTLICVGSINYVKPASESKFIDADIGINIENYVPKIEGNIKCVLGTKAEIEIVDKNSQNNLIKDTLIGGNEEHSISYSLPNIHENREYLLRVVCSDGEGILLSMEVDIDTSVFLIDINGNLDLADKVNLSAAVQSINTDLINQNINISDNYTLDYTLLNLARNCSFRIIAQGYAVGVVSAKSISGNANDEFKFIAIGQNIESFDGKNFILKYNSEHISPVSFFGVYPENIKGIGKKGKVEIVSFKDGEIIFKINDIRISEEKTWSGVLNIFKFRFNDEYSGETTISIQ